VHIAGLQRRREGSCKAADRPLLGNKWAGTTSNTFMIAFLEASAALHRRMHDDCTPSRPARPACMHEETDESGRG
jgi:hypothetical protein